jgi:hypothetical protein
MSQMNADETEFAFGTTPERPTLPDDIVARIDYESFLARPAPAGKR